MSTKCVWCGIDIEDIEGQATMDTCDSCEDFFEDNIDKITSVLNDLLKENENSTLINNIDNNRKSWISYSLITAIHMLSSKPHIEFKDSQYKSDL